MTVKENRNLNQIAQVFEFKMDNKQIIMLAGVLAFLTAFLIWTLHLEILSISSDLFPLNRHICSCFSKFSYKVTQRKVVD